ncbi:MULTISPECIES: CaiB/BaiF CoA transferase family protein [unclassified Aeromicrobium]|uniref:CaiB/BaiF CoA transferase family protein n=1 Tax=unclassified Aeromicrobium TaxID=2633570 RepID=UPI00396B3EBE
MRLPLEGVTVVAVEQAVAAPLATRQLADLGARVIKVERRDGGDLSRGYDHVVDGTGAHFVWLNRGKESVAVDLKTVEGRDIVRRLVASADVFVQNLAPGAAKRLGLGTEELRSNHPELITVDLSGFGTGGPHEQRKAYDMLIQAEAGLISITGTPDTAVKTGIPTADIASGLYCAQAVLAALLRRWRFGEGASIEVTMLEATVEWLGHALYTQMFTDSPPPRMGLGHTSIAPYDAFPTVDGEVLIGVQNDRGWRSLLRDVLDAPELVDDPRFVTNVDRVAHREACDAVVASHTRGWSTDDLIASLSAAGVPAAQVKQMSDVVAHPQLRARGRWREVATEHSVVPALLPPVTFSDVEAVMGTVPALGQHTRTVLEGLGLCDQQIDELVKQGVVTSDPRVHALTTS